MADRLKHGGADHGNWEAPSKFLARGFANSRPNQEIQVSVNQEGGDRGERDAEPQAKTRSDKEQRSEQHALGPKRRWRRNLVCDFGRCGTCRDNQKQSGVRSK